jgi:2,3-bisphosphoglycerate-dependent phosphoglycerate mutase
MRSEPLVPLKRRLRRAPLAGLLLLLAGCAAGLQGHTYTRAADGGIGPVVPQVALSFIREDGGTGTTAQSDAAGRYTVSLQPGRYYVLATHPQREDYASAPGFAVVPANRRGTLNVFLREPQVTTVLIVRHAEKQDPASNVPTEPLSVEGLARADLLREVLFRSGATAVYSTDAVRTRSTVAPFASAFQLPVQVYANPTALATEVLASRRGDVVLVAAHSNTIAAVANAFGAGVPNASMEDYDNLFVLSAAGTSVNLLNLQYGVPSSPDTPLNQRQAMTLLLVGNSVPPGSQLPQRLLQTGRKAGVGAIFTSTANNALLAPLAAELGLNPTLFDGTDPQALANQLIASHAQSTVLVSGSNDELRQLLRQLGAYPFPVIYAHDLDHLVVVTRFPSGAVRVVPLRF